MVKVPPVLTLVDTEPGRGWLRGMRNAKGFTLTEVLVAVVIAALSFTMLYAAGVQCLKHIWAAREASRAALAADYEIETLGTASWDSIVARGSSYAMSSSNNPALALLNGGSGTVQLTSVPGNANAMKAVVNLSWAGYPGAVNTNISVVAVISKNGFLR
jgi:prepilin-type N-terminal cleavage/methylation domain-containing protein